MPQLDWIHVAMFLLGLAMQWLASKLPPGSATPTPTPTPAPPQPAPIDPNALLDLAHKLLNQLPSQQAKS